MARTKGHIAEKTSCANFDEYKKQAGTVGFTKFSNISIDLKEGIAGVGCCVSLSKSCHIFVMSTDSENLEEALSELRITKHERSKQDVSLIALYPAELKQIIEEKEEEKNKKIYWVLNQQTKWVKMYYSFALKYHPRLQVLGEAERCTKLECKLLLRGLNWSRDKIEALNINDEHPDNDIPF